MSKCGFCGHDPNGIDAAIARSRKHPGVLELRIAALERERDQLRDLLETANQCLIAMEPIKRELDESQRECERLRSICRELAQHENCE